MEILDIPICRWSIEEHDEKYNAVKQEYLDSLNASPEMESYKSASIWFDKAKWHCWRYNEFIGWISLSVFDKGQIRGRLFLNKKRVLWNFLRTWNRKEFIYIKELMRVHISCAADRSNEAIFKVIVDKLKYEFKLSGLSKYYLDLRGIEIVGKHLNWRDLLFAD